MDTLIKSSISSAQCPKMASIFGKGTKSAYLTGKVNFPYSNFLGSCSRRSYGKRFNQRFLMDPLIKSKFNQFNAKMRLRHFLERHKISRLTARQSRSLLLILNRVDFVNALGKHKTSASL